MEHSEKVYDFQYFVECIQLADSGRGDTEEFSFEALSLGRFNRFFEVSFKRGVLCILPNMKSLVKKCRIFCELNAPKSFPCLRKWTKVGDSIKLGNKKGLRNYAPLCHLPAGCWLSIQRSEEPDLLNAN
ncbi:hypothetical protein JTB14_015691 [Gonioctena quinquepunctata]|nr:hypothetical protein JTB14_015691 [Gonioctena quinquepunctata]